MIKQNRKDYFVRLFVSWIQAMRPPCFSFGSSFCPCSLIVIGLSLLLTICVPVRPDVDADFWNPHDYRYLINHPELCGHSPDIQLLIMVHTACHHFESRLAIRDTWGSVVRRKDVRLLFLLGQPTDEGLQSEILYEDRMFEDILQENFLDTYYNLTLKSIMMVKWVTTYCPNARHVLKIDDDCFLNPDNLMNFLEQNSQEVAIFGRVYNDRGPVRSPFSKYYMSYSTYPGSAFPEFADGPSYLMTQEAVPLLYTAALTTKPIYLEDVYLNGMCAEKAGIPRILDSRFTVSFNEIWSVSDLRQDVVSIHSFSSNHLRLLWWLLHDSRGDKLDHVLPSKGIAGMLAHFLSLFSD